MKFSLTKLLLSVAVIAIVVATVAQNMRLRTENKELAGFKNEFLQVMYDDWHEQRLAQSIVVNFMSSHTDSKLVQFFRESPAASLGCEITELPEFPSLQLATYYYHYSMNTSISEPYSVHTRGFVIVKKDSLKIVDTLLMDHEYGFEDYPYRCRGPLPLNNHKFATFQIDSNGFSLVE